MAESGESEREKVGQGKKITGISKLAEVVKAGKDADFILLTIKKLYEIRRKDDYRPGAIVGAILVTQVEDHVFDIQMNGAMSRKDLLELVLSINNTEEEASGQWTQ